jgi:hypothetical protein
MYSITWPEQPAVIDFGRPRTIKQYQILYTLMTVFVSGLAPNAASEPARHSRRSTAFNFWRLFSASYLDHDALSLAWSTVRPTALRSNVCDIRTAFKFPRSPPPVRSAPVSVTVFVGEFSTAKVLLSTNLAERKHS